MRRLALAATLAGLLAVTASAPATALYVESGELPLLRLDLEVRDQGCPDGAALCLVDLTGNLSSLTDAMRVDLHVVNHAADAAAAELFATQRVYDGTADGANGAGPDADGGNGTASSERTAPELLVHLDLAPGEEKAQEAVVKQGTGFVRVQAMAGGAEAELDREIPIRYTILADQSPEDMADDSGPADAPHDPAPGAMQGQSKDSPGVPMALLVLGVAAALVAARRIR
jgi:hypothetical protein